MSGQTTKAYQENDAKDVVAKVTGKALYTRDLKLPEMLYAVGLYSDISCGKIKKIDIELAQKEVGVKKILFAKDIPGRNSGGSAKLSHPLICEHAVNYTGDVVALIAAETEEIARNTAKLIAVEYEEEKGCFTIDEAKKTPEFVLNHVHHEMGDVNEAFKEADVVVEGVYTAPTVDHVYLECESALAVPEPDGRITIYGGSQQPYGVPAVVAEMLGCERERIQFIGVNIGGAFGGKSETTDIVACRAALLAWYCKKPVLFTVNREESFRSSTKRHETQMYYKLGANKEGYFTALEACVYVNKGAYIMGGGINPSAFNRIYWHYPGPYKIPNVNFNGYLVRTNIPCGGAMRSPGIPQISFAMESQIDQLAEILKIDPLELRKKNALKAGMQTSVGDPLRDSVGISKTIEEASKAFDYNNYKRVENERYARGVGVASFWHGISYTNDQDMAGANIYLQADGSFLIRTGIVEFGQDLQTTFTKFASHELDVPPNMIRIAAPNTDFDPDSKSTTSSRGTVVGGLAIRLAAKEAIRYIIDQAATISGITFSELQWQSGKIRSKDGSWDICTQELFNKIAASAPLLIGVGRWQREVGSKGYTTYGYANHIAEVKIDKETGFLQVLRLVIAQDVGKVLNYQALRGQAIGGAIMSLGYGLLEKMKLENGRILNQNLNDYRIPLFHDIPEIECCFVEEPCSEYVFGAKGAGEPSAVPTAAAISNACYNAIGLRMYELPITQEAIVKHITS